MKTQTLSCEICQGTLRRRSRSSLTSYVMSCLCIFPYRCTRCKKESTHMNWEQAAVFYSVAILLVGLLISSAAWYRSHHRPFQPSPLTLSLTAPAPNNGGAGQSGGEGVPINLTNVLTNQDVIELAKVKLRTDVMVQMIRNSPHNFQVDPHSVVELKQQGTPDDVISAMIDCTPAVAPTTNPLLARLAVHVVH